MKKISTAKNCESQGFKNNKSRNFRKNRDNQKMGLRDHGSSLSRLRTWDPEKNPIQKYFLVVIATFCKHIFTIWEVQKLHFWKTDIKKDIFEISRKAQNYLNKNTVNI